MNVRNQGLPTRRTNSYDILVQNVVYDLSVNLLTEAQILCCVAVVFDVQFAFAVQDSTFRVRVWTVFLFPEASHPTTYHIGTPKISATVPPGTSGVFIMLVS